MQRWLSLLASFACLAGLSAADWPQWRGPDRNGLSSERISTNWPADGPKLLWRAEVGIGFSSIAVCQGRAYTLGNANNKDTVWCLDALTGKLLWTHCYPSRLDPQWYEGGPGATPTVLSNRVYTISKWGDFFCLDAVKGTVLWRRDLRQDHFKPNRWGFAGSPLLWRNLVDPECRRCRGCPRLPQRAHRLADRHQRRRLRQPHPLSRPSSLDPRPSPLGPHLRRQTSGRT